MYETKEDLIKEAKVINAFCEHFKCEKQKLPIAQKIDYALCIQKKVVGFAFSPNSLSESRALALSASAELYNILYKCTSMYIFMCCAIKF